MVGIVAGIAHSDCDVLDAEAGTEPLTRDAGVGGATGDRRPDAGDGPSVRHRTGPTVALVDLCRSPALDRSMAVGTDAVVELIEEDGSSYPVSVARLERQYALANVDLDERGYSTTVGELLAAVDVDRFESREHVEEVLDPVIRRELAERRGLLDRIRAFLRGG